VNLLDLFVVLLAVAAAVGGYRLGFFGRVVSWLGLALGFVLGATLLLPFLLRRLEGANQVSMTMVAVATLVGSALVGQGLGLTLGNKLHIALPEGGPRQADQSAGAAAGIIGVLVLLWLMLPTLVSTRGWLAEQAYGSSIAHAVHDRFPSPPPVVQSLRRLVGDESWPLVFGGLEQAPDVGKVPAAPGLTQATTDRVVRSTVKVEGIACRRVQEGSGFVVSNGLIVTNAHVVAGEDDTKVDLADGSSRSATVVAYDPRRDLAILRVHDLNVSALPLQDAKVSDRGGVFGHPGGGPLRISPFRISEEITAVGSDIYDQQSSRRHVLVLASNLHPGDSGSALIDTSGRVIGVAFAVAPDKRGVAYALDLDELRPLLAGDLSTTRDTGDCLV
jgi:S1-C subfamily serine protease